MKYSLMIGRYCCWKSCESYEEARKHYDALHLRCPRVCYGQRKSLVCDGQELLSGLIVEPTPEEYLTDFMQLMQVEDVFRLEKWSDALWGEQYEAECEYNRTGKEAWKEKWVRAGKELVIISERIKDLKGSNEEDKNVDTLL